MQMSFWCRLVFFFYMFSFPSPELLSTFLPIKIILTFIIYYAFIYYAKSFLMIAKTELCMFFLSFRWIPSEYLSPFIAWRSAVIGDVHNTFIAFNDFGIRWIWKANTKWIIYSFYFFFSNLEKEDETANS